MKIKVSLVALLLMLAGGIVFSSQQTSTATSFTDAPTGFDNHPMELGLLIKLA